MWIVGWAQSALRSLSVRPRTRFCAGESPGGGAPLQEDGGGGGIIYGVCLGMKLPGNSPKNSHKIMWRARPAAHFPRWDWYS